MPTSHRVRPSPVSTAPTTTQADAELVTLLQTKPVGGAVELVISWLLRVGVWSSISIILVGFAMLIAEDHATLFHDYPGGATQILHAHPQGLPDQPNVLRSYGDVIGSIRNGDAYGVITLGLLVLLFTPMLRVGVSIVAFAIERDRLYVLITSVVLALLVAGVALGKAGG